MKYNLGGHAIYHCVPLTEANNVIFGCFWVGPPRRGVPWTLLSKIHCFFSCFALMTPSFFLSIFTPLMFFGVFWGALSFPHLQKKLATLEKMSIFGMSLGTWTQILVSTFFPLTDFFRFSLKKDSKWCYFSKYIDILKIGPWWATLDLTKITKMLKID